MTPDPMITVVIPSFNRATTLGAAIEGVLAQTWRPLEVIVVDDGSTDNTPLVVERFGRDVRYIRQENAGAAAARNRGVKEASGGYIALQDSDDLCEPDRIKRQVEFIKRHNDVGLVACAAWHMGPDGRRIGLRKTGMLEPELNRQGELLGKKDGDGIIFTPAVIRLLAQSAFFNPVTALFRKDVFQQLGGYDPSLHPCEDYELMLRMAQHCGFGYISTPLYSVRRGGKGVHSDRLKAAESMIGTFGRLLASPVCRDEVLRKIVTERLAGKHTMAAAFLARRGRIAEAKNHLRSSLSLARHPMPVALQCALSMGPLGALFAGMLTKRILKEDA